MESVVFAVQFSDIKVILFPAMPRDIELCESIKFVEQHPRLCPRDFKTFIRTVVMLVEIIVRTCFLFFVSWCHSDLLSIKDAF